MIRRTRALALAAAVSALFAAATAHANGVDASGELGGGYSRMDHWAPGDHAANPAWDWEGGLDLAGGYFDPGVLQWGLGASYRSLRSVLFASRSKAENLEYHLNSALLSNSPVPISLVAARQNTDFSNQGELQRVGSTLANTERAQASLRTEGLPTLQASVGRLDAVTRSVGAPDVFNGNTDLRLGLAHNLQNQQDALGYNTGWNEGTYAESNFRSHAFDLQANAEASEKVTFRLMDRYYLRLPTVDSPINPRVDNNTLGAGVQWRPQQKVISNFAYSYTNALAQVPESDSSAALTHALSNQTLYSLSKDLTVNGVGTLGYAIERRGAQEARGASQSVGGGALWAHDFGRQALSAGAGATVGVVEPEHAAANLALGINGTGGASLNFERSRGEASYSGSVSKGALEQEGWGFDQRVQFVIEGITKGMLVWRGRLDGAWSNRHDRLLGDFRNRTASLTLEGRRRSLFGQATAGISDGLASGLAPQGSGVMLPAGFNTVNRFAQLSTTSYLGSERLTATALARTVWSQAPGRDSQWEHDLALQLGYTLGAVTATLEERYSYGGSGEIWQKGNLLLLRLSRSFGASF